MKLQHTISKVQQLHGVFFRILVLQFSIMCNQKKFANYIRGAKE
jgi:hypothetical protein